MPDLAQEAENIGREKRDVPLGAERDVLAQRVVAIPRTWAGRTTRGPSGTPFSAGERSRSTEQVRPHDGVNRAVNASASGPRDPDGRLFLRNGRMSEQLDEGLRQINEWRRLIAANRDTAQRPRVEMGLGLTAIDADPPALLPIARKADLNAC